MNQLTAFTPADAQRERPQVDKRGYKWIAREIEALDPYKDYELIWALSTTYYVDDFFMNIVYTTGIQNFTQPPAGSIIMGEFTKKAINQQEKRLNDTLQRFWQWFELGPSHPDVKGSIEKVNQIHMGLAKKMPGTFPARDFIYTCCWTGADIHRLRLSLGLPGFTKNQQIATHLFWRELCGLFMSEEGAVVEFPKDFNDMLQFMEDYENEPWEQVESGKKLAAALTEQFSKSWFPVGMQWFGRQMILSLQKKKTRDLMQMGDPNPVLKKVIRGFFWLVITMKERVLPDPKLSTPEKARAMKVRPAQHIDPPLAKVSGCPFHAKTKPDVTVQ
jgi:hypothetical protein